MSELVFRPHRRRRTATLNLTSLIDVLFLLLIFFMLTSTFRRRGEMELQLPDSSTSSPAQSGQEMRPAELVLRADGTVLLDGRVQTPDELREGLARRLEESPDAHVLINAESEARHADVVRLIDLVRETGFKGLSIGTQLRPPAGRGP